MTRAAGSRRRGKGEGTVYQRKDGRWVAELVAGRSADGGRRRVTKYAKTRGEAQDALFVMRQKRHLNPSRLTVRDWLETWKAHVAETRRPSTALRYARIVDTDCSGIRALRLDRLSADDVRDLYDDLKRAGRSSSTIRGVHVILRTAFAEAVRRELIDRNPFAIVHAPPHVAKPVESLSVADARCFLKAIRGDQYEALYALAIATGLRMGELFGLRWRDVDLVNRSLHIRQQVVELTSGKLIVDAPLKTARARRIVALGDIALRPLIAHASRPHDVDAHVFTDRAGGPMRKTNFITRDFHPLLDRAGIARFNFHRLRHTAATLAKAAGADLLDVSRLLGHASTSITAAVYVDLFLEGKRSIAIGVDGLLTAGPPRITIPDEDDGATAATERVRRAAPRP